jgi:chemotaxis protein CheD
MVSESETPMLKHYLYPGALFADPRPHMVTTILGSCVAVCLWDPVLKIGGINHYLLPLWNGEGLPTPKYGNVAIEKLIENMLNMGSCKKDLIAKVFGGATLWENTAGLMRVGDRNVVLARELLQEHRIAIISSDVQGNTGRKIIFNAETGTVFLRRHRSRQEQEAGFD